MSPIRNDNKLALPTKESNCTMLMKMPYKGNKNKEQRKYKKLNSIKLIFLVPKANFEIGN